jgi:hypothetical protein
MEVQGLNLGPKPGKLFFPRIYQKFLKTVNLNMCRKLYNKAVLTDRHVIAM